MHMSSKTKGYSLFSCLPALATSIISPTYYPQSWKLPESHKIISKFLEEWRLYIYKKVECLYSFGNRWIKISNVALHTLVPIQLPLMLLHVLAKFRHFRATNYQLLHSGWCSRVYSGYTPKRPPVDTEHSNIGSNKVIQLVKSVWNNEYSVVMSESKSSDSPKG